MVIDMYIRWEQSAHHRLEIDAELLARLNRDLMKLVGDGAPVITESDIKKALNGSYDKEIELSSPYFSYPLGLYEWLNDVITDELYDAYLCSEDSEEIEHIIEIDEED